MEEIIIKKIGIVRSQYEELEKIPANGWSSNIINDIILSQEYVDGLQGLKENMLIHVIWWFDKAQRNILKNFLPNEEKETGVFAMRSPHRPNPIALSLCEIISIKNNIIRVRGLEALNNSPILDIKKAIMYDEYIL